MQDGVFDKDAGLGNGQGSWIECLTRMPNRVFQGVGRSSVPQEDAISVRQGEGCCIRCFIDVTRVLD